MFLSFDYLHGFNFFTDDDSFGLQSDVFSQLNFLPTSKKYKPVAKKKKKKGFISVSSGRGIFI